MFSHSLGCVKGFVPRQDRDTVHSISLTSPFYSAMFLLFADGFKKLARVDDGDASAAFCGEVFPIAADQEVGLCGHRDFQEGLIARISELGVEGLYSEPTTTAHQSRIARAPFRRSWMARRSGLSEYIAELAQDSPVKAQAVCAGTHKIDDGCGRSVRRKQARHEYVRVQDDPHERRSARTAAISAFIALRDRSAAPVSRAVCRIDSMASSDSACRRVSAVKCLRGRGHKKRDRSAIGGDDHAPLGLQCLPDRG